MKITTFNPLIVTKDAENVIKLFEALSFEKRHSLDANTGAEDFTNVRMKNADGFYVDISNVPVPQDMTLIRMNVDDFDEGEKFLSSKGFKMASKQSKPYETSSCKCVAFRSEAGVIILLVKLKKDHEQCFVGSLDPTVYAHT